MAEHHPLQDIEFLRENLLKSYKLGFPILKELVQNAEDAGSTHFDYGWVDGISDAAHPLLKTPALFLADNGKFTKENARSIRYILGGSSKPNEERAIGKFGLGLKSVFHLCEAFFYISPSISDCKYRHFDIFNPWADSQVDPYHKDWDNFSSDDCEKVKSALEPILKRDEYKSKWFILWIPLRQRNHTTEKKEDDGIQLEYIKLTDEDFFKENEAPGFLSEESTKQELALLLPLLNSLQTIRYWEKSFEQEKFSISIQGDRRHYLSQLQRSNSPLQGNGNIQLISPESSVKFYFYGKAIFLKEQVFDDIKAREGFPSKFKNIQPHIAVIISHWQTPQKTDSTLITRKAVFLPIGDNSKTKISESSASYCLTLHGYYFLDFARTGILGDNQDRGSNSTLEKEWNDEIDKRLLVEIIPTVEQLKNSEIDAFCQGLKESQLFQKSKEKICSKHQFVYRVKKGASKWELISVEFHKRTLSICKVPNVVWDIAPELEKFAEEVNLIQSDRPNLIYDKSLSIWKEHDINRIFTNFDAGKMFGDKDALQFFINFLSSKLGESLQNSWKNILKDGFQSGFVVDEKLLKEAIALLDKSKWFTLDSDEKLLQDLYQVKTDILIVPQNLAPSQNSGKISGKDGALLIEPLIQYRSENPEKAQNLIKKIVLAIPVGEKEAFQNHAGNLKFIPGHDFREKKDNFYSFAELQKWQSKNCLFDETSQEYVEALQLALKNETIILVDGEIANKILDEDVKKCDKSACLKVLGNKPELSTPENRKNLLRKLL